MTRRIGTSPFDRLIREITENEEVLIACPYISAPPLQDITEQTDE